MNRKLFLHEILPKEESLWSLSSGVWGTDAPRTFGEFGEVCAHRLGRFALGSRVQFLIGSYFLLRNLFGRYLGAGTQELVPKRFRIFLILFSGSAGSRHLGAGTFIWYDDLVVSMSEPRAKNIFRAGSVLTRVIFYFLIIRCRRVPKPLLATGKKNFILFF